MHGDADVWSPHKHEPIHMVVLVFHKCHMLMLIHWWITKASDYGQEKEDMGWLPINGSLLVLGLHQWQICWALVQFRLLTHESGSILMSKAWQTQGGLETLLVISQGQ